MKLLQRLSVVIVTALLCAAAPARPATAVKDATNMIYSAEDGAVVGRNIDRFHNRPLYGPNIPSIVLAGDRPNLLYLHDPLVCGTFMLAVARGNKAAWLDAFADTITTFLPNHTRWNLIDSAFPGLKVTMEAVPLADEPGFAVRVTVGGAKTGDRLIWMYGGVGKPRELRWNVIWDNDPASGTGSAKQRFDSRLCEGNKIEVKGDAFSVRPPAIPDTPDRLLLGRCSETLKLIIADSAAWADPLKLAGSAAANAPIVCGTTEIASGHTEVYWAVRSQLPDARGAAPDPAQAFAAGLARAESYRHKVSADTPDERLDAAVTALNAGLDGYYYPPVYRHGGMMWNVPFPGWRVLYGPIAFGCHEQVQKEGKYYIGFQVTSDEKQGNRPDPNFRLTLQAPDSRMYGRGWISQDQAFYNFQEEFFDQLIYEWRATADPELERILRPALELHLERLRECYDPDGNGVYESYIDTWATDSVWYDGAEGAATTSRAYNAHRAAAELARRAGDVAVAQAHDRRADKIRAALLSSLWIRDKGYLGESRENTGLRRRRDDSWLYTISLPIDADMMMPQQAAQMCHYTEWGLERTPAADGGERCWLSNWAPYAWSIRELEPAENFHLALAYYRAGLGDDAWKLVKGSFYDSAFNGSAPGAISSQHGADFADCTSMFGRVIVEGLFGYRPDYPNGLVRIAPQFPSAWDHASIKTPDVRVKFTRRSGEDSYEFSLARSARMLLRLPVRAGTISGVTVNGRPVEWTCSPGFGQSWLELETPRGKTARVTISWQDLLPVHNAAQISGDAGQSITLTPKDGRIISIEDPQGALAGTTIERGQATGTLAHLGGHHLVFALVDLGQRREWQLFKISIRDPKAEEAEAARYVAAIPSKASWNCIDISKSLNADIRTVYQQQYLTPRATTSSVQMGIDGWSNWCFAAWASKPPTIDLTLVDRLLDRQGKLLTPQGVPVAWPGSDRNIAFTSQWDNWPRSVTVPVNASGEAVWFLVAGSASHMQTMVAHAVLRLKYSDGAEDSLELVHPINYLTLENPYTHPRDKWPLRSSHVQRVQLGNNCYAQLVNLRLRPGATLDSVSLETLSKEVVVGLMGVTLMAAGD